MPRVVSGRPGGPVVIRMVYNYRDGAVALRFDVFDDDARTATATAASDYDGAAYAATATASVTLHRRAVRVLVAMVVVEVLLLLLVRVMLILVMVVMWLMMLIVLMVVLLLLLVMVSVVVQFVVVQVVVRTVVVVVVQVVVQVVVRFVVVLMDGPRTTCMANDPASGLRTRHSRDAQLACRRRFGDGARGLPTGVDVRPHVLRRIDCLDHHFVERRLWRHVVNVFHSGAGRYGYACHCPLAYSTARRCRRWNDAANVSRILCVPGPFSKIAIAREANERVPSVI